MAVFRDDSEWHSAESKPYEKKQKSQQFPKPYQKPYQKPEPYEKHHEDHRKITSGNKPSPLTQQQFHNLFWKKLVNLHWRFYEEKYIVLICPACYKILVRVLIKEVGVEKPISFMVNNSLERIRVHKNDEVCKPIEEEA
jgi:hypothetical protein